MRMGVLVGLGLADPGDSEGLAEVAARVHRAARLTLLAARYAAGTDHPAPGLAAARFSIGLWAIIGGQEARDPLRQLVGLLLDAGSPFGFVAAPLAGLSVSEIPVSGPESVSEHILRSAASRLSGTPVRGPRGAGPPNLSIGHLGLSPTHWREVGLPDRGAAGSAALALLREGSREIQIAADDRYHWRLLGMSLTPAEPELLLAAAILHQAREEGFELDDAYHTGEDPVLDALLGVAADLLERPWDWLDPEEVEVSQVDQPIWYQREAGPQEPVV